MALKGGHCSEMKAREREFSEGCCLLWKYEEVALQEFLNSTCQGSPHMKELKGRPVPLESRELRVEAWNVIR